MTEKAPGEDLLSGLTPAQAAAVTSEAAPLCIIACAGAGKTRVLTRRIAYRCLTGSSDARHTLALTFTRKAAGELQERLAALGLRERVAAGTFHSHAAAQLQRWWADRRQRPPALLERKGRLLGPLLAGRPGLDGLSAHDVAGHIEWAKSRGIDPPRLPEALHSSGRRLPRTVDPAALAAVYERYEHEKRRRGLIDFDDILARCAEAIERDPEFAAAQRWRWRHIHVDEFQDLNPLQHRLLLAWLGNSVDLCVVGDPNQAIYAWNGADPSLLADLPRRWPSTEIIHLDRNHRSTAEIVAAAAAVLGPSGSGLEASRQGTPPRVRRYPSEADEARAVVEGCHRARAEGLGWGSMAVLARTNAQLRLIHGALVAAGVPCHDASAAPAAEAARAALAERVHQPLRAVVADLENLLGRGAGSTAEAARAYCGLEPDATVAEWLDWLPAALGDRSVAAVGDAVTLCSFHRSKGLEWPWVWVVGAEEGLVPMARCAEVDERQLFYVALSRASERLSISWAATRRMGTALRPVPRQPSRWLEAVLSAAGGPSDGDADWRPRFDAQRHDLRRAAMRSGDPLGLRRAEKLPRTDPELRADLAAWRSQAARHSGVPPHLVLHDATLDALASLRPRTLEELLAVPGIGPVKANRCGPALLSIVARRAETAGEPWFSPAEIGSTL
ncbi:MAG TPA: ATP-dependent DNA helicase UvrD2 [Acidimicrobiales bacterium]|nr:ATP-dependent DNA helicase UvrD2 [Acidimicrobiales bacterium]